MSRWMGGWVLAASLWLGVARAQEPVEPAPVEQVEVEEAPVAAPEPVVEAVDVDAAEEEVYVEEEVPSPWTLGLVSSMIALAIGGFSAVLGIWVDRDKERPVAFAGAMSVLISAAIFVGMFQSYLDAEDGIKARSDLDRMLSMLGEIGAESGDPDIAALLEAEGRPMAPSSMPNLTPPSQR